MPRILVTNDDGVHAEGIHALAAALQSIGDVTVVAPLSESSAIGHALTLRRPLRLERVKERFYSVDGTPTDCVNIAVAVVMKGELPDIVVSGINTGWNLGDDVTYSGTVAGALEGALLGIPAIAVSLRRTRDYVFDFGPSAEAAAQLTDLVLRHPLPDRTFLNVNVPKGIPKGFRRTVQGKRNHITKIAERLDPRGKPYYWIEEGIDEWAPHDRSDYHAVKEGFISVTLLHPDLTAHYAADSLEQFPLPQETETR
ncbi:MAG TPA: 5'/3'-nucleotidase SurE [Vicinamibacterales bacterium]|nr:5'/3'-nucleotidase SurE [Vicinamibacterales bacterium]